MAKLIKISSNHYLITDDEETVKGDFILYNGKILEVFDFNVGVLPKYFHEFGRTLSTCYNILCGEWLCFPESIKGNKITHSSIPLEYGLNSTTLIFNKIKELSLTDLNN
jgi:hypothetical protein